MADRTPAAKKTKIEKKRTRIAHPNKPAKKRVERFEGELEHLKKTAIILRVAGLSSTQIAASLGEYKSTVKGWFKEPEVISEYHSIMDKLDGATTELLRSYKIEAVHGIMQIARTAPSLDIALKAYQDILDRSGTPKSSRSESKSEHEERHSVDEGIFEAFKDASPELQEKVASMAEGFENLLKEMAEEKNATTP